MHTLSYVYSVGFSINDYLFDFISSEFSVNFNFLVPYLWSFSRSRGVAEDQAALFCAFLRSQT